MRWSEVRTLLNEVWCSGCGRTCLSCSDVRSVHECSDVEVCADDEVCYTNRYTTRDMVVSYDFGCSFPQVIQRRFNGYLSFDRTWEEYKTGFGSVSEEYWLGNDNIHQISTSTSHKLSIYIEDFTGSYKYANYSHFSIGDELRKYQLRIYGFKLTSGLSSQFSSSHNTHLFSTKDQTTEHYSTNCAVYQGGNGGWWYSYCGSVNLNGPYMAGPVNNLTGMICLSFLKLKIGEESQLLRTAYTSVYTNNM
ncbi:Ryncolin-2,Ryncolin-1,Ficolin-2,Ficolin-1,Ryncolin-3 [Mytilus edulis]|uniref:Ryncolin-2,Ryncolin-1,Ficolin-2,Ficolin-1,Ryncoli n-3 n=1 Tax=Mytilus edulis TaxID=6550 RepID=A0A8S3VBX9_MYTED|nr:Ryncolin-2,Ryncolin-1,Ficolin-2,Ficolin-1,Ryncolin-3 [Mytilus edulis]